MDAGSTGWAWLGFALMTAVSWGTYGVFLHTGLGRAPLSPLAAESLAAMADGFAVVPADAPWPAVTWPTQVNQSGAYEVRVKVPSGETDVATRTTSASPTSVARPTSSWIRAPAAASGSPWGISISSRARATR